MAVTTVGKTIGTTGTFSTLQLWEDGAPANLTTSNNWTAGTFVGTFTQGETVTGTGITAGKFLDSDGSTYITFGTTTTPAAGITVTGSTSGAHCVISGVANVGVIWQGQCQNQSFSGTGVQLTIGGSTVSSTAYKELTTVAGASFRDNANAQTNALRFNTSNGCGITGTSATTVTIDVGDNNTRISNLQIAATGTNGRAINFGGSAGFFDYLIIEGTDTGASTTATVYMASQSPTIRNSLIVLRAGSGDRVVYVGTGSPNFYNCTIVTPSSLTAPTSIFSSDGGSSGTITVKNCGMFAGAALNSVGSGTATYNFTTCYSSMVGPPAGVTNATYANEFQNVSDATRDFRLVTGAAQKNNGTTDSTNAANDIVGVPRPQGASYDVGCWEFGFVAATIPKMIVAQKYKAGVSGPKQVIAQQAALTESYWPTLKPPFR